jgi:hypothetical protein
MSRDGGATGFPAELLAAGSGTIKKGDYILDTPKL